MSSVNINCKMTYRCELIISELHKKSPLTGFMINPIQSVILARRYFTQTWREGYQIQAALERYIRMSVFFGMVFYDLDATDDTSRSSVIFFALQFLLESLQQYIPSLFEEKIVVCIS